MTNKEKYMELCKEEKNIPIFSQYWWMDAVCGKENWDVLLVQKNGEVVATLPYYKGKKYGFKYIIQPKLTQTNGVWIKYPQGQKNSSKLSYEKELMLEVIDKLNALDMDYYSQNFHYSITNWLPFYWNGYKQTTRYTYVIEDTNNLEAVFNDFSKVVRKNIRKSEKLAKIYESDDIEKFYMMDKKTFDRQGIKIPYTLEFLKRLDNACRDKKCRKIYFAEDKAGNTHSSSYIVWDERSVYQLMSGTDPKFRGSEFKTLLIWEALKYASDTNKVFDFEGSMIKGIEEFFRKFGAVQKQYFHISKTNSKILKLRQMFK